MCGGGFDLESIWKNTRDSGRDFTVNTRDSITKPFKDLMPKPPAPPGGGTDMMGVGVGQTGLNNAAGLYMQSLSDASAGTSAAIGPEMLATGGKLGGGTIGTLG